MLTYGPQPGPPIALVFDVTGEQRIAVDLAELSAQDGTSLSDPGSVRVGAGGERLITLAYTDRGQARVSAFSLPELRLVAGPVDVAGGGGVLLELASGEIIVGGGLDDGTSADQGLVQIVDKDLSMPPREVPDSSGLVAFHQSPDDMVLLGANDGRVAVLDPGWADLHRGVPLQEIVRPYVGQVALEHAVDELARTRCEEPSG